MMNQLNHIQDYLNGKSKEEVELGVASGKIAFDDSKYRIVRSPKTISGYVADFTEQYKNKLNNILNNEIMSDDVYSKLDFILSEGYSLYNVDETEIYTNTYDIFTGTGKKKVKVFEFIKDDRTKELLVSDRNLVKGSKAMAERMSDIWEERYEELINRQEYLMDILGIDRELAAHITTKFKNLEDEEFDEKAEMLPDMCLEVAKRFCIQKSEYDTCESNLYESGNSVMMNSLSFLIGMNGEHIKVLNLLVDVFGSYNIEKARDVLIAGAKHHLSEILFEQDINLYREFVNDIGKNPEGFTKDISILADLTNMNHEVINFILKYGNEQDFIQFFTQTIYLTGKKKTITKTLDGNALKTIYKSWKKNNCMLPISFKFLNSVSLSINNQKIIKKEKEQLMSLFINRICEGNGFNFDIVRIIKEISKQKNIDGYKIIEKIINQAKNIDDVQEIISVNHPALNVSKKLKNIENEVLSKQIIKEQDVKNILDEILIDYDIKGKKITVKKKLCGLLCKKEFEIPDKLYDLIMKFEKNKDFSESCKKLFANVIKNGITESFESDGINVSIMNFGDECSVSFIDGNRTKVMAMDERDLFIYNESKTLSKSASVIKKYYQDALSIKDDAKKLFKLFCLDEQHIESPDESIAKIVSSDGDVRIASKKKDIEASYLISDGGNSMYIPELGLIQRMARWAYAESFKYEGMLKNQQHLYLNNLFTPQIYELETGMPICFSDAICGENGDVYIDAMKAFHSDNIRILYENMLRDEKLSTEEYKKYIEIKSYENETTSYWEEKIKFVDECIRYEAVNRRRLFQILHDLNLDAGSIPWVKEKLSSIDQYAVKDYAEYEKNMGVDRNQAMDSLV